MKKMTIRTSILWSLKNLRRNPSRSILTMIGIVIGMAGVITIVAIGEAYKSKRIEEITGDNERNIMLNTIFMPNDDINNGNDNIYGFEIILKENVGVKESIKDIERTLNEGGSDKDKGKYEVFDSSGIVNMLGGVLNTITAFIAIVAGISLFIAGIGVMNMVYTSVSERTLEIGIKRALGARKKI